MPYDDKEFLKEGDAGYAEAKAKREARWTAREAELDNAAHVDKGEGVKAEIVNSKSPEFKSKIGKKIADTLTKAGDKAEDLRVKKDYLSSQVQRITGKHKPKQKLPGKPGYLSNSRVFKPTMRQPKIISSDLNNGERGRSTSSFMNDMISGQTQSKSTSNHISDLIGGNSNSNNRNTTDLIFGSGGKKKGKKNDPFGGLLG
jgi:hypothetical protein